MIRADGKIRCISCAILVLLLLVPRALRCAYPDANFEDDHLLYLPFLLSLGDLPYRDFACPYNPGWLALLGAGYATFGLSYRVAELFTGAMVVGISLFMFAVGWQAAGVVAGATAAILFSWHPLVFSYHVFAVENCVTLCVWGAAWFLARNIQASRLEVGLAALLMAAAVAFKQTAVSAVVGLGLYLWVVRRDSRGALFFVATWATCTASFTAAMTIWFREAYWTQALLFHFVKGELLPLAARPAAFLKLCADPISLVGVAGLIVILLRSPYAHIGPAPMLFGAEFAFAILAGSTYWAHAHIPACAALCSLGGCFVEEAWRILSRRSSFSIWRAGKPMFIALALVGASALVFHTVVRDVLSPNRMSYGFGGKPREEISQLASTVQRHTATDDVLFAPPIVALEAKRRTIVPNIENAGVMKWLEEMMKKGGVLSALGAARGRRFWEMVEICRPYWVKEVEEALRQRQVKAMVLPNVWSREYPESLSAPGYEVKLRTKNYTLLLPAAQHRGE